MYVLVGSLAKKKAMSVKSYGNKEQKLLQKLHSAFKKWSIRGVTSLEKTI
jgi:hypothetical protein